MSETFLTNCPQCKSVFKLRKEHLEMASGHVRCGNCQCLFLATESLVSMQKETQKAGMAKTVNKANENLLNNALGDIVAADEHVNSISPELNDSSPKISSLFTNLKPFLLKYGFYAISGIILLYIATWYLYLWPNRLTLAQDKEWRPLLEASCTVLQCRLPPLQRMEQYQVSAIDVSESRGGQQQVSLLLKNNADFAQPFPKVRIILSDIKGEQFTTPVYTPAQYLPDFDHNTLIQPNQSVQIGFSFSSDNKVYSGYQVELVE